MCQAIEMISNEQESEDMSSSGSRADPVIDSNLGAQLKPERVLSVRERVNDYIVLESINDR